MKKYSFYTDREIEFLKQNYSKLSKRELAIAIGRNYMGVCWKCRQLKLKCKVFLSDTEKGYLAGFLDGEGSIQLTTHQSPKGVIKTKRRPFTWGAYITITNTNHESIAYLNRLIGGATLVRHYGDRKKPIYRLTLCSNKIRIVLPQIKNLLIVKRNHAELLLQALELINESHYKHIDHDKELAIIYKKIRGLNNVIRKKEPCMNLDTLPLNFHDTS